MGILGFDLMVEMTYIDPHMGDVVKIVRNGNTGDREWKVTSIALPRVEVDLTRGSLLGPQWENLSDLVVVRRP